LQRTQVLQAQGHCDAAPYGLVHRQLLYGFNHQGQQQIAGIGVACVGAGAKQQWHASQQGQLLGRRLQPQAGRTVGIGLQAAGVRQQVRNGDALRLRDLREPAGQRIVQA
jgi:hypothetical protein